MGSKMCFAKKMLNEAQIPKLEYYQQAETVFTPPPHLLQKNLSAFRPTGKMQVKWTMLNSSHKIADGAKVGVKAGIKRKRDESEIGESDK